MSWSITQVGDGNLNLVFIVNGGAKAGSPYKQAPPYVRLVGEAGRCRCRGLITNIWHS